MRPRLLKRIEHGYVRPILQRMRRSRRVSYGGIEIRYRPEHDGGGTAFGQDYIPFLRALGMPKQQRVFEWCCGPGFIGFSLLGNGLCESLCLADINSAVIASCHRTISANGLGDRAAAYQSDNLKKIPPDEKWNLVVGNPPHFIDQHEAEIRAHDPGWQVHREFFATVSNFLAKDGVIVLQENNRGSTVDSFRKMIAASGLDIVFTSGDSPTLTQKSAIYYIGIMRRGDDIPVWVASAAKHV
jgi:methylase of polypeptide subunit release factors